MILEILAWAAWLILLLAAMISLGKAIDSKSGTTHNSGATHDNKRKIRK